MAASDVLGSVDGGEHEVRIELPNNWLPRPYQRPLWRYLEGGGKRAIAVWARRHGKDDVGLHWTAIAAHERVGNYWHLLPQFSQARKAIWNAINPHTGRRRIDEAFPLAIRSRTRDQEMFIEFKCGSTWQLVGSDSYDSLVGSPPVGVVFSEWALADPNAWAFIRPILAENDGWALFITTPRGMNHAAAMYESAQKDSFWFAEILKATDTGVFSKETLDRELQENIALMGEDEGEARFNQEYMCDFSAAMPGSFYGRLMQRAQEDGRISNVPHDPSSVVETWWDLGVGPNTATWFVQRVGRAVHFIDYHEAGVNDGIPEHVRMLNDRKEKYGYIYSDHVFPHDTNSRDHATGKTRRESLIELGVVPTIQATTPLSEKGYKADGIDQVRRMLARSWFDKTKCERGILALKNYRRAYDEQRKIYSDQEVHDWTSHACDAARVGAMHRPIEPTYFEPWMHNMQQPYDMMEH